MSKETDRNAPCNFRGRQLSKAYSTHSPPGIKCVTADHKLTKSTALTFSFCMNKKRVMAGGVFVGCSNWEKNYCHGAV